MLIQFLIFFLTTAHAAPSTPLADQPFVARPFGFLIPSFSPVPSLASSGEDGFDLEAHLGAEARLDLGTGGQMGALVELDLTPSPGLKDAYALYRPTSFLRVDLGQFKIPYGLGFQASDTRRLLPMAPVATEGLVGRDEGIMVTGSLPIHGVSVGSLQLAAFNGEGPNIYQDPDHRYLFVVRGLITPFGARVKPFEGSDGTLYLGLGGGLLDNTVEAGGAAHVRQYGADVQFAWNVLSVQGELLLGSRALEDGAPERSIGGYGTLSVFLPFPWVKDHVQLIGRFGQSDPQVQSSEGGDATREFTGGLDLYWFAAPGPFSDVKLQLAFSHVDDLDDVTTSSDQLVVAATVRF